LHGIKFDSDISTKLEAMKTMKLKKAGLLVLGFLLTAAVGLSQEYQPTKQERKELKQAAYRSNFYSQDTLIVLRKYVLQADYLQNKIGDMVSVSNTLNFIKVDGEKGVLQTGSDFLVGYNGVGGVTAEGSISNYKINRNMKSLSHHVSFTLMTNIGTFNINMNVLADNTASATIRGNSSGSLTWRGNLAAIYNARVFKGPNTY
jgi:hypothetical protein